MGFTKYTTQVEKERIRMNESIRAREVRVLGPEGENFGVLPIKEAIAKAMELGLDLIEISPNATPPVCRITDYGKYKYEQKKKDKDIKSKAHVTETKEAQVKIGTSTNDMNIKASKIAEWLRDGHRVKVDLFLWGRYKYMEHNFLKDRLERFLAIIPETFKLADDIKKSPKGLSVVIERDTSKSALNRHAGEGAGKAKTKAAKPEAPVADDEAAEDAESEEKA